MHWAWEDVLVSSLALDELERVDGINEQMGEVSAAWLVACAVNKPDELSKAENNVRRRMKLDQLLAEPDPATIGQVLAQRAKAERIARRKRKV